MKSILFNDEMVRALLDGRKTQLRFPITRVKGIYGGFVTDFQASDTPGYDFIMRDKRKCWNDLRKNDLLQRCPFGQIGVRLWVRETFCLEHQVSEVGNPPPFMDGRPIQYLRDGLECSPENAEMWLQPHYKATDPTPELCYDDRPSDEPTVKWKPSILMPRWASRITLEITDIRIERLQEITEEDAIAEGVLPCPHPLSKTDECLDCYLDAGEYACAFLNLWNRLYAKKGLGVDVNPWVWVLTFRRVK